MKLNLNTPSIKAKKTFQHYIGIMSGTSMDAVDVCLLKVSANDFCVEKRNCLVSIKIPTQLKISFQSLLIKGEDEIHRAQIAGINLANLYNTAVAKLLKINKLSAQDITAIGAHGQTIRHQPNNITNQKKAGYTVQILNASVLAEKSKINVVYDFRARDVAANGQGAPLIPAFHLAIYEKLIKQNKLSPNSALSFLNIGGMANISVCIGNKVFGCDSGPGNCLLDWWITLSQKKTFDKNGEFGKSGKVQQKLLNEFLSHPFFKKSPPKSCGAEEFNGLWLNLCQSKLHINITPEDVQATLTELTAVTIVECLHKVFRKNKIAQEKLSLIVFGGGVLNKFLITRINIYLQKYFREINLASSDNYGFPAQAMEACAFAWFAYKRINNLPANVPQITGAKGGRILGAMC